MEPFVSTTRRLGEYGPPPDGPPVVRVETPGGDPVWVVTDEQLGRRLLTEPRISKDPAFAPRHWRTFELGLEPPGADQPSLTTLDGEPHLRLRRAHGPLFTARRLERHADRIRALAKELLLAANTGPGADLAADFTTRYPLTVICELLGVPAEHVDAIAAACRTMLTGGPEDIGAATVEITRLVGAAFERPGTPAAELRARLPAELSEDEARYLLFGLVFAGQITTESALGFLIAHLLAGGHEAADAADADTLVQDVLRRHPPAPYTLWRFATERIEIAGETLPAGAPVLVRIEGTEALAFGAGPHYCVGAQLAVLELTAVVEVLRTDFPLARLAVPVAELPVRDLGSQGRRLTALPVVLEPEPA